MAKKAQAKDRALEDLRIKLQNILNKDSDEYDKCKVTITRGNPRSTISVEASRSNTPVPLNFSIMKVVSDALGTEEINESSYSTQGCDSCGYGAVHEWTLECKNCKV
jgi:hypothetical protein